METESIMDDKNKSSKPLHQLQNSDKLEEEDDGGRIEDDNKVEEEEGNEAKENGDENRLIVFESSNNRPVKPTESEVVQLETLALPSQSHLPSDSCTSSHLVSEVQVDCTLQSHESTEELEHQTKVNQQQPLTSVATPTGEAHMLDHLQLSNCQTSSLELSPTSVTQSILSIPSPNLQEKRVLPLGNSCTLVAETKQKNFFDSSSASLSPSVKTSSVDGYNWRKYGQKQVKSPNGSRSYYRCTYSECYAKKIECSDNIRSVIEVIYKSSHNHGPPQKINCIRERKLALLDAPVVGSDSTNHPVRTVSNEDPAKPSREKVQKKSIPEEKQHILSGSDRDSQMNVMREPIDERTPKIGVKKNSMLCPDPVSKTGKRPKLVVHADSDVGISEDGYRWRKYGQKIVKGTPHPRNYYRCTSAGCPVRKHIEMANDNKSQLVITYKGVHDHDMPVPKKRHRLPSAPLLAAAAPASISETQWSVGKAGELTGEPLNIGGERAIEPAPTLLSIGFEIKPC